MSDFTINSHPVVMLRPRILPPYAWVGHIPFAYLLVDILRPRTFVELGTDSGNSYLAMCQAVDHLGADTKCFAVDTWEGDEHARFYSNDIYQRLRSYHDPRYGRFSRLLRKRFDQALEDFEDGSVDLLHVDGLHTYEAVKHDFETWLPKLSDRAVVIFHDSAVEKREFGVARFIREISETYRTFEFKHSNGLAVVEIGREIPEHFRGFIDVALAKPEEIRRFFEAVAATILDPESEVLSGGNTARHVEARLYYRSAEEPYDEARSVAYMLPFDGRVVLRFGLPGGIRVDYVRLDPADIACLVTLHGGKIETGAQGGSVSINLPESALETSCEPVPTEHQGALRLLAFHADPHIEFALDPASSNAIHTLSDVMVAFDVEYESIAAEPALIRMSRAFQEGVVALSDASDHRWAFSGVRRDLCEVRAGVGKLRHELVGQAERLNALSSIQDGTASRIENYLDASTAASEERSAALLVRLEAIELERSTSMLQLDRRLESLECRAEAVARAVEGYAAQGALDEASLQISLIGRLKGNAGPVLRMQLRRFDDVLLESASPQVPIWRVTGLDSRFELFAPGERILPAGWYLVETDLRAVEGQGLVGPGLYADYGEGYSEATFIPLPLQSVNSRPDVNSAIVLLQKDANSIRLDPTQGKSGFRYGWLNMRRISSARAALRMIDALSHRAHGDVSMERGIFGLFSDVLRKGRSFAGAQLYWRYAHQWRSHEEQGGYAAWVDLYGGPRSTEQVRMVLQSLAQEPLISVLVPVYNPPERWLRKCIESVRDQSYWNWELCLADDASPDPSVRAVLDEYSRLDPRIKVVKRAQNGHISRTSNSALELASGTYCALLDHDDELHPDALLEIAQAAVHHPEWQVIYSDEDKIDAHGRRYDPYFKSDWNYDLFLSHNCISHLGVYRTSLLREIGGFREGYEGSQDWDLALRCIENLSPSEIGHIPKVLYHWRAIPGSTALAPGEKNYAHVAAIKSIQSHLDRIGRRAEVQELPGFSGNYRVVNHVLNAPLASIIIPTRDGLELVKQCIDSIFEKTTYAPYEIIVVDNGSVELETLRYFEEIGSDERIKVLRYDLPFNYSAINNFAAQYARGDVLVLMNNDIEVITPGWLEELVSQALREDIGAVGAMLYYPNDTIQHAGVLLGFNGGIAVNMYGFKPRGWLGQMIRARLLQNYSAVTAACLAVRKSVFEEVGGFDERLAVAYNDVDLCLRIQELGLRNLWTPFAEFYHHESASRGHENTPEKIARFQREVEHMEQRWGDLIADDPAYNPNLANTGDFCAFAFPPRTRALR